MQSDVSGSRFGDQLRANGGTFGLLILVPLLFYGSMILGGKEPAAPDTLAVRPLGVWALETTEELQATPQWNPLLFSGMPSYGSYIHTPASDLNPWKWILKPFGGRRGLRYFLFMLMGGFSAFAFFRRQGISDASSTIAALAFVMTPYLPGLIEAGHSTKLRALMHVPLLLLAIDLFLSRPGAWAAAFLTAALALLGWANHPQILYYALMIGFCYGVGRLWTERSAWTRRRWLAGGAWFCAAGALAFCLIAEPTLAVREYAPYSIRGAAAGGGSGWAYATAWSFPPRELVTFLFPDFYGLKSPFYFGTLPFTQSTHYLGIVFLFVAAYGFARCRQAKSWIWFVIAMILLLIGFGEHFPILYKPLFVCLPYFNKFRVPSMIYSLLPIALGFLVGLGLDSMARPAATRKGVDPKRARRPWLWAGGAAALCALLVYAIAAATKSRGIFDPGWIRGNEMQLDTAQLAALRETRWEMRSFGIVRSLLLLAVTLAAVPVARLLRRPWSTWLLGAILLIDLGLVGSKFVDYEEPERIEAAVETTPEIEFLKQQPGPFRVFPLDEFTSNRYVAFGIATIGGYQPAKLKIYQDLLERNLVSNPGVLSMLNVEYLLSKNDLQHPAFEKVTEGIYRYRDALPRAWFVPSWKVAANDEALLRALAEPQFDPSKVALFSGSGPSELAATGLPERPVTLESYGPHRIGFRVADGEETGLLVISEIHYPAGWHATIDSVETPILRVNHCLRALVVPPGEHEIVMAYRSKGFDTGRKLNRAGGLLLVLLFGLGLFVPRLR